MEYEKILQYFVQKDNTFFSTLYQNNYYKIKSFVLKNTGFEEDAKEVFQIAFIVLFERITQKKFKPENINQLEAYLFQIGKYKWLDSCKQKNKTLPISETTHYLEISNDDFLEYDTKYDNQIEHITSALQQLKEPCKSILKQFYYKNLSYQEIAINLNYSASTLKTMKYRCLTKLKKIFTK